MSSETEVANRALQKLGASPILDISDTNEKARIMKRAFAPVRRSELRKHVWSFAKTRVALARDKTDPISGFAYSFTPPGDYLRPMRTADDVEDWSIEAGKILTDAADEPFYLLYIRDEDPTKWDPIFAEAMAARLAYENCEKITQSDRKSQMCMQDYRDSIAEARRANAIERPAQPLNYNAWLDVRY
jgi:hypothetical protein